MRVTKLIREYVEKTITAKMPYGVPTAEYKAACSKLNELATEVKDKVAKYAKKLCEEATAQLPEGFYVTPSSNSLLPAAPTILRSSALLSNTSKPCVRSGPKQSTPFCWNWNWARPKPI